MIIGGSFGLIASVFLFLFGVLLTMGALLHPAPGVTQAVEIIGTGIGIAIAGAIIQFVAGIAGVKNAKKPEKATFCIVLGSLTALFYIASQILTYAGGASKTFLDYIIVVMGLVVPALYIVGAIQNKMRDED